MITEDKDLLPAEGIQVSLLDVLIPIGLFMGTTFFGLWYNGYDEGLTFRDATGNADASELDKPASGHGNHYYSGG